MPSPRFTVRLPHDLAAQVQERLHATGATFTTLVQEALAAYLADSLPTAADSPADSAADTLITLQEVLNTLTRRVEALEQVPTVRRHLADRYRPLSADILPTRADRPPTGADRYRPIPADSLPTGADTQALPYDPTRYFLGVLCPRGHDYGGTGQSVRKRSNHSCRRCDIEQKRARRQRQREQRAGEQ